MKRYLVLLSACVVLAACQPPVQSTTPAQAAGQQLETQSDMSLIVGKTLTLGPGQSFVISQDGTLQGSWDGNPLIGTYEMRDGFFCRTLTAGPRGPSSEDCQLFILDGAELMGTRDRGNGVSFTYTVT